MPRSLVIVAVAVTTVWVVLCSQQPHMSVNPASRYATMEAIVEHGTLAIDATSLVGSTVDKVQWEGQMYSSKPPLLPLLAAPIYATVRAVTGEGFREANYPTVMRMRLFVAVAPWLAFLAMWAVLLRQLVADPAAQAFGLLAMAVGGLPTAYASHLDNHSFAVLAMTAAALAAAPIAAPALPPGRLRWVLAGLAAGAAPTFDLGATPIVGLAGLVVAARLWTVDRGAAALFLAASLVFPCAQAVVQWAYTGSPFPFYVRGEAYDYEGSYWRNPVEFDALKEPKWLYAFHALVGHHGLFAVTPWLLLGLPAAAVLWRTGLRGGAQAMSVADDGGDAAPGWLARLGALRGWGWWYGAAVAAGVLFVVVYYVARTTNYGGRCVGMRWWMVLHPMLGVAAVQTVARTGLLRRRPFLVGLLVGLSAASALSGALNPWEEGLVFAFWRALGWGSVPG